MRRNYKRKYRVSERKLLNKPGWHGIAAVIAEVEDTRRVPKQEMRHHYRPNVVLQILDCSNACTLEFDYHDESARENSLFKARTLRDALVKFTDALEEEFELLELREAERYNGVDYDY